MKRIHAKYASALAAANGVHRKSAHQSYEIANRLYQMDNAARPATTAVSIHTTHTRYISSMENS